MNKKEHAVPCLQFLAPAHIESIRETAMRIVSRIGVKIHEEEVYGILKTVEGVTAVDSEQVVKLSEKLVVDCLDKTPKTYHVYGRDATRSIAFGEGQLLFKSTPSDPLWAEAETGSWRRGTIEDTRTAIDLADALPNIDIVGALVEPSEVPAPLRPVHMMAELVKRTRKPPRVYLTERFSARYIIEILKAVAGGEKALREKPITQQSLEPISPLRYGTGLDLVDEFAGAGQPIIIGPMVQSMLSGPATLAGTAALCIAENLVGLVIIQSLYPGTSVSLAAASHVTNPRSLMTVYGSPEQGLLCAAVTQVIKSYGLPAYSNSGYGDSKVPDAQAGLEKGMTLLLGALAGGDSFGHTGVAGTVGASLIQLVIDDEMIGYLQRMMQGFHISPETLAYDVIASVGIGGSFASEEHTLRHMRQEYWEPQLFDWNPYEQWIIEGKKTMMDRAVERRDQISRTHEPDLIDDTMSREIDRIVQAAERDFYNR